MFEVDSVMKNSIVKTFKALTKSIKKSSQCFSEIFLHYWEKISLNNEKKSRKFLPQNWPTVRAIQGSAKHKLWNFEQLETFNIGECSEFFSWFQKLYRENTFR